MRGAEVLFKLEQLRPVKLPNEVPDEANFGPTPRIYVEYNFSIKNTLQGSYGGEADCRVLGRDGQQQSLALLTIFVVTFLPSELKKEIAGNLTIKRFLEIYRMI